MQTFMLRLCVVAVATAAVLVVSVDVRCKRNDK